MFSRKEGAPDYKTFGPLYGGASKFNWSNDSFILINILSALAFYSQKKFIWFRNSLYDHG